MSLLITGGAGFIGSGFVHLIDREKPNCSSVILDKLTYAGRRENLANVSDRHQLTVGDICDSKIVEESMNGVDLVIHFAAESHVTRSEDDPERFYRTNVEGTKTILKIAKKLNIPVIHISTDEVYGPIINGYFKETDKIEGDSQATSAYAKSKSQADDVARSAMKDQQIIVVRPTNNYGPRQYPEKALPRWITNLIDKTPIPLWGDGRQVRDWLFVEDTARAILFLIENGKWGEVYNIGVNHDPEIPNIKVAEKVCAILKVDSKMMIKKIPDPRPDHDMRYGVDNTKITQLGYKPNTQFEVGLSQTVAWYQENEAWWRPIKAEAESIYQGKEK